MPMGLCNAPGAFQRLMELVLSGLTYDKVLVYLDDIIVFGCNFPEHLENLRQVFQRIRRANLEISPNKCALFRTSINFLGHVISKEGVQTDPKKIEAVKTYPIPANVKTLRAFLGLVGFYRKFIQNFGDIASPLYKLMQKEKRFQWTTECQQAFEKLKERLLCAPILGFPNERDIFTLCTDASLTGIGAVLSQNQNNAEKVIAYTSKSLQKGQRNYSATKRELYAVVFFTNYFKEYLLGQKFRIVTDHRALVWLYSFKDPDGIVARWLEKLSSFDFETVHRPGTSISHADALFGIPPSSSLFEPVTVSAVNTQSARDHDGILVDYYIIPRVIEWVRVGERPPRNSLFGEPRDLRCYWNQFQSLELRDSKLYRRMENSDGSTAGFQLCIDRADVPEIPRMSHDVPSGGHMGVSKTLCVRSRYYWSGIKTGVENWVSGCATYQKRKNPKQKHRHSMQIWPNPEPFHHVSVDILGPLPESNGFSLYTYDGWQLHSLVWSRALGWCHRCFRVQRLPWFMGYTLWSTRLHP